MKEFINNIDDSIRDMLVFFLFVIAGVFLKFYKSKKLPTFKRVIVETIATLIISGISYFILEQYFDFNRYFNYSICCLLGSMSSQFLDKVEDLFDAVYDAAAEKIKGKKEEDELV